MKHVTLFTALFSLLLLSAAGSHAAERPYDYIFFENSLMKGHYFYSEARYTSPSWVKHARRHLPVTESVSFTPGNALELTYVSAPGADWYGEIQYSPVRGNDFFRHPSHLSLQIRLKETIDADALPSLAIRYADSTYTPYLAMKTYLENPRPGTWQTVRIPLGDFGIGEIDNTRIKKLAAVAFGPGATDSQLHTVYLDDVELLPASLPALSSLPAPSRPEAKGYERHIDLNWTPCEGEIKYYRIYRSFDGTTYQAVGTRRPWMNRYTDFLGEVGKKAYYKVTAVDYALNESGDSPVVSASTRPMTDEELLDMVQEAHIRYYWEGAEPCSGLARENIPGRNDMIATGASGFGMMAILTGIERGFIPREEGVERFLKITAFLEKADKFHGAVSHFIDGPTGKTVAFFGPKDNGGDLVETSFLFQGLLAARQYFDGTASSEKQIRERIDALWKNVEWSWYKQFKDSPYLYWHWSPDQAWVINHRLIGWNETMITYLLAIMSPTHPVSPTMYYSGWASQEEYAREYRADWSQVTDGEGYTNGNTYYGERLKVGVSNGGPLFFIHYSYLGLDPHQWTDKYVNYFENNRKMAEINQRYCIENPGGYTGYGEDCWGLTASDFTWNYQAQEPMPHRDNGTIAPTGALASFPYTPDASMKALKNYYRRYGSFLWGEYGFRDACNLTVNWASPLFMGLNQAPVAVMIENYRTGLLWRLFMSHPDVREGLRKLEAAGPANAVASAGERPLTFASDDEWLTYIQRAHFNYMWDGAEPHSGLAPERIHIDGVYPENDADIVTTGGSGFGIAGLLVGIERGFITRKAGVERLCRIVGFLEKADRFHGIWPHWLHGPTGKVKPFGQKDNGGDLVESAFLMQGLLAVRQYFREGNDQEKALAARIDRLWREMEWSWYQNGGKDVLYWHWSPDYGWEMNFPLEGYNECLITYILAASSPTYPIPASAYHKGWARNGGIRSDSTAYGHPLILKHNGAEAYGGPLFWAHYSYIGLCPAGLSDSYADYWAVNRNQALINHAYCVENPKGYKGYGSQCWGLTASYSVEGYHAHMPANNDQGVITPTAALSSYPYTPKESAAALKHFYFELGDSIWGPYGFYDAFSIDRNWYPRRYLAIDQCTVAPMIENYRTGLVWRLFMSCPEIQAGLKKLGFTVAPK